MIRSQLRRCCSRCRLVSGQPRKYAPASSNAPGRHYYNHAKCRARVRTLYFVDFNVLCDLRRERDIAKCHDIRQAYSVSAFVVQHDAAYTFCVPRQPDEHSLCACKSQRLITSTHLIFENLSKLVEPLHKDWLLEEELEVESAADDVTVIVRVPRHPRKRRHGACSLCVGSS